MRLHSGAYPKPQIPAAHNNRSNHGVIGWSMGGVNVDNPKSGHNLILLITVPSTLPADSDNSHLTLMKNKTKIFLTDRIYQMCFTKIKCIITSAPQHISKLNNLCFFTSAHLLHDIFVMSNMLCIFELSSANTTILLANNKILYIHIYQLRLIPSIVILRLVDLIYCA